MKSKISCWRLVRSIPAAPCSAGEDCSTNVCSYDTRGSDGNKRRLYWPRPRGGGGIGRRARLRALWGDSPVEVRVLFGASAKPLLMQGFRVSGFGLKLATRRVRAAPSGRVHPTNLDVRHARLAEHLGAGWPAGVSSFRADRLRRLAPHRSRGEPARDVRSHACRV